MSGDASPDGLQLNARPRIARMGKWPIYAVLAALLLLGGVLVYSVNFAHNQEEKEEAKEAAVREEDKPLWLVEGSGLALNPNKDKVSGVLAPERPPQEPVVIIQRDTEKQKQVDEEAENIRRTRAKAYMSALASPLLAKRENRGGSTAAQAARDGERGRREAAYPAPASQEVIRHWKYGVIFCPSTTVSRSSRPLLVAIPALMPCAFKYSRNSRAPGFKGTSWVYFSLDMEIHSALITSRLSGRQKRSLK